MEMKEKCWNKIMFELYLEGEAMAGRYCVMYLLKLKKRAKGFIILKIHDLLLGQEWDVYFQFKHFHDWQLSYS